MKKALISIFIILICFKGFGQTLTPTTTPGVNNRSSLPVEDKYLFVRQHFGIPRYNDTAQALTYGGIDSCGALIYTYDIGGVWFRYCTGVSKKWVQLLPSGGGLGSGGWLLNGNSLLPQAYGNIGFGLNTNRGINFLTNSTTRFSLDSTGILPYASTVIPLGYDSVSKKLSRANGGSGSSGWSLTGNSGTTAGTNFVGTTDGQSLIFKVNSTRSGILENSTGNTSFGVNSLVNPTTASGSNNNSAFGGLSMFATTTGANNTALGYQTLRFNTTGSSNVAIGNYSGAYNTTGSDQFFLNNYNTTTYANDTANSLVYGKFNATSASQRFKINGRLEVRDGTQGAGKVFTSDANGNGSWATSSGGTVGGSVNYLTKILSTGVTGNSALSDDGTNITSTEDLIFTAKKSIFNPTTIATEVVRINRPVAYTNGMAYKVNMAHSDNGDGTYNDPVVSGFNAYGSQNSALGGNYTSIEPDYWDGSRKKEYHYEVYHPYHSEVSRLFSSTYTQRDSLGNSSNQWDFRGNAFTIQTLKSHQYVSIGGDSTGVWQAQFFASNGVSGIKMAGSGSSAVTVLESSPTGQGLQFKNWGQIFFDGNLTGSALTYTKSSNELSTVKINASLIKTRNGSTDSIMFDFGSSAYKAGTIVNYGTGEIQHFAQSGGYFQTFWNSNSQAFRTISGGLAGSSSASGNLTISSTSDGTKGKIFFGSNSVYDEANIRVGIGTTSPSSDLHINNGINPNIYLSGDNASIAGQYSIQLGSTSGRYVALGSGSSGNIIGNRQVLVASESGVAIGLAATGYTNDASAIVDITSTAKGFLLPRMTTTQKNAISSPAEGLVIYDTTLHKLCVRTASAWEVITSL